VRQKLADRDGAFGGPESARFEHLGFAESSLPGTRSWRTLPQMFFSPFSVRFPPVHGHSTPIAMNSTSSTKSALSSDAIVREYCSLSIELAQVIPIFLKRETLRNTKARSSKSPVEADLRVKRFSLRRH
jgi:hypothetical protein